MPADLGTQASITIAASASRVWEGLTTPGLIKRWFFDVDTETDWAEGRPIVHRGEYQGRSCEDRGAILTFEPERLRSTRARSLAFRTVPSTTRRCPGRSPSMTARPSSRSAKSTSSEETKSVSETAWQMALQQLKKLLET